jgi:hypothetical protein
LNGASIGTETITLTDPNTPSTLKWNFSDKHDGTAEGFNVHDDQSPPCYVEKASDGTWSLTLTADLANRQDQSPGNNWDYIETIGGTVYLNFKSWDTDGYWQGPYTRAQWSSSIGSETIRIYEHSSYSEQYNNGIYLIQESSSSTPTYRTGTSQAFSLDSGSWFDEGYTLFVDDNPTTASSGVVVNGVRQYEWDLKNSSNNLFPGPDHYFYFIPGSSATSGLWYLGLALASRDGSVITDIHGGGSFNETNAFVDGLVPYGAPAYRTGTSQGFAFTSGNWKNNGYSAVLDDEANSSEGKLVNGVRQWEFDMPDIGGGRLSSGASHWIHFVPGTAEDNGTWYRGGSVGTRSGRTINFGNDATFDETSAFVSGLVPYGDIP